MRTLIIAALSAMLSLPACAQTEPIEDVHASPSQPPAQPLWQTPEEAPRSWRRVLPDTARGERLRDFFRLVAQDEAVAIEDVFDDAFFAHTPRERLGQILGELREASGGSLSFVRVLKANDELLGVELVDANGTPWTAGLQLAQGSERLVALDINAQPPRAEGVKVYDTWGEVLADVRAIDAELSFAVRRIGAAGLRTPVALHESERVLNIAQIGQLFLFGGAANAVASGEASWEDPVAMNASLRSLPPSEYAQADDGTSYALGEYLVGAGALRDSAAADAGLSAVGRGAVRAYYESVVKEPPAHAYPWLSMRDYTLLKLFSSEQGRERYAQSDEQARRATLAGVPDTADLSLDLAERIGAWQSDRAIDRIGWFASADDLVRTLADLASRSAAVSGMKPLERALLAKAGVSLTSEVWPVQVVKVGGEPGVFAFASLLRRFDGQTFSVVMLLNDQEGTSDWREAERIALGAIDLLALED